MKTVNLLPRNKQQELRYESYFHSVMVAVGLGLASLALVAVAQLAIYVYLQRQSVSLNEQIAQAQRLSNKEENTQLKTVIQGINTQLKDFTDLAAVSPTWSEALRKFSERVPEGVRITLFTGDTVKKKVDIMGWSSTRDGVIQLYNNINDDKENFRDIDYPLENVARPSNVDFHFTFYVQDKILQTAP